MMSVTATSRLSTVTISEPWLSEEPRYSLVVPHRPGGHFSTRAPLEPLDIRRRARQ